MTNQTITLSGKELQFTKDKDGVDVIDTGIVVPTKTFGEMVKLQAQNSTLVTILTAIHMLDKLQNASFTIKTLTSMIDSQIDKNTDNIKNTFAEIISSEGYTMDDIDKANLVLAINYDTQKINLFREDDVNGLE